MPTKPQVGKIGKYEEVIKYYQGVITAVTVTSGEKHDGNELTSLVEKTKRKWSIFRQREY